MDIDSLFKKPVLPAGNGVNKRKAGSGLPDESPEDLAKRIRRDAEADEDPNRAGAGANGKGKGRAAVVEDEDDDDLSYARPETPADLPDPDDDDEDGRFFGGGLNDEQEQILDIFDKAGDDSGESALSIPALRRQLAKFERTAAKNAEQRGKFPDDPSKFIESESDLDASLKHLLPLTQNPGLYYPELVKQGSAALLVSLLSHENTDIAIDVVEVLQELTDEDVGQEEEEEEAGPSTAAGSGTGARMAMGVFIDELLNNSLLDLLIANLARLDESEPTDSQGVFHILGVFENLLSFLPPIAETIAQDTTLISWLLKRIQKKEYDSNKQYASEVLDILLQNPDVVGRVGMADGVEVFLKVASQYRKKDPADSEEVEFMENVFNGLCALLGEPTGAGKAAFVDAEGVELMIIMMKEKLLARTRAAKVLDYALQTEKGTEACERFVEMLGLKSFFTAFMGKGDKKKAIHASSNREDEEHILGILASLLTNLPSDSTGRIRVLAKFVDDEYAKVERLLELREGAVGRLSGVEGEIQTERDVAKANGEEITEEDEDEWYIRRIDAGLSVLQSVDYILAWIVMEDDGAMQHAKTMLRRKGLSLQTIIDNLKEFRRNVGIGYTEPTLNANGEAIEEEEEEEDDPEAANRKVILTALIDFLQGSL